MAVKKESSEPTVEEIMDMTERIVKAFDPDNPWLRVTYLCKRLFSHHPMSAMRVPKKPTAPVEYPTPEEFVEELREGRPGWPPLEYEFARLRLEEFEATMRWRRRRRSRCDDRPAHEHNFFFETLKRDQYRELLCELKAGEHLGPPVASARDLRCVCDDVTARLKTIAVLPNAQRSDYRPEGLVHEIREILRSLPGDDKPRLPGKLGSLNKVMAWLCDVRQWCEEQARSELRSIGLPPRLEHNAVVGEQKPHWDLDRRKLYFGGKVVRSYPKHPAPDQTRILKAFEAEGWPRGINNPLGDNDSKKLNTTIKNLNRKLTQIRFKGDGTGKGIIWERVGGS